MQDGLLGAEIGERRLLLLLLGTRVTRGGTNGRVDSVSCECVKRSYMNYLQSFQQLTRHTSLP
jgi:hypothetical protein